MAVYNELMKLLSEEQNPRLYYSFTQMTNYLLKKFLSFWVIRTSQYPMLLTGKTFNEFYGRRNW